MKIKLFTTFLIVFTTCSIAQNTDQGSKYYKATIKNITLEVPAGFEMVENQQGFLHKGSASTIMVSEINNSPVSFTLSHFNTEQFQKNGEKIISTEQMKTSSGVNATIYTLTFSVKNKDNDGTIDYERLILFTGNETMTICLVASYPVIIKKLIFESIKTSLLSVAF